MLRSRELEKKLSAGRAKNVEEPKKHIYIYIYIYYGLEWASPPQLRIGHILNVAVRPNELQNAWYEVQVFEGLLGYVM